MFGFCHLLFIEHIFFIKFITVVERLPRCTALTALSLVRTLCVVAIHVLIKVGLYFFRRGVKLLSEGHFVKLILDDLVQSLDATIGPDDEP